VSNTIDLRKDFDLVVEEKQRETEFFFIDFSEKDNFNGCLARQVDIKDGIAFYNVCPMIRENGALEQAQFIDALECGDEKKYNAFCSWFEKNSFFQLRRSLVSRETAICLK